MLRRGSLWGVLNKPTQAQCDDYVRYNRLLTHKEIQRLFPDCRIIKERFLGLTKSYIVVKTHPCSVVAETTKQR
jgi:hypothetical protein